MRVYSHSLLTTHRLNLIFFSYLNTSIRCKILATLIRVPHLLHSSTTYIFVQCSVKALHTLTAYRAAVLNNTSSQRGQINFSHLDTNHQRVFRKFRKKIRKVRIFESYAWVVELVFAAEARYEFLNRHI